jgi:hypothetical protein
MAYCECEERSSSASADACEAKTILQTLFIKIVCQTSETAVKGEKEA